MAHQLTSLGISVLALLRERPMHGYEMLQTLSDRQADRIVRVRPGSLYHTVERLTGQRLIRRAARGRDGNRPERVVYEITDAGVEALAERVRELVATPVNEYPQFTVALAEIDNLDPDSAVHALDSRVVALEAGVAEMTAQRNAGIAPGLSPIVLEYLLAITQAEVTWLRQCATSLRSGRWSWPATARPETVTDSGSEVQT
ncbi:PadR family transcriptional regulator [Mycobacterium botniense]|uniref:PadR family transcriptional regulator n=1 Tax=Mycobacterium botniense TaxID=84962 RepID=A0A7I9XZ61_9MYCO|nr:PadR family transcriptional regulator [Mycobacterium botniense]GFG75079.1 PadR family transcriptional regulator [Mycobacterium botniense]